MNQKNSNSNHKSALAWRCFLYVAGLFILTLGTIAAMIGVGRDIAAYNAICGKKAAALMGMGFINGRKKN